MRGRLLALPAVALGLGICACGSSSSSSTTAAGSSTSSTTSTAACAPGSATASGSTALQPLAQKAAQEFQLSCSGATITVSGGGSSAGLSNVAAGTSDIGDSDVPVSLAKGVDPSGLKDHQVAIVIFSVVVNPKTNVTKLSTQQVQDIFSGKVTNWKDVGGADVPVTLIERKVGSGTRRTFDKTVMKGTAESATPASTQDSTQLVLQGVASADGGVSYLSAASAGATVTKVALDGVDPTAANLRAGTYPFYSHEHMYTKGDGSPTAAAFISFVLGDTFQGELAAIGFVPVATTSAQSEVDKG